MELLAICTVQTKLSVSKFAHLFTVLIGSSLHDQDVHFLSFDLIYFLYKDELLENVFGTLHALYTEPVLLAYYKLLPLPFHGRHGLRNCLYGTRIYLSVIIMPIIHDDFIMCGYNYSVHVLCIVFFVCFRRI